MGTPTTRTCTTTSTALPLSFTTLRPVLESLSACVYSNSIPGSASFLFFLAFVRRRRSVVGICPFLFRRLPWHKLLTLNAIAARRIVYAVFYDQYYTPSLMRCAPLHLDSISYS